MVSSPTSVPATCPSDQAINSSFLLTTVASIVSILLQYLDELTHTKQSAYSHIGFTFTRPFRETTKIRQAPLLSLSLSLSLSHTHSLSPSLYISIYIINLKKQM